MELTVEGLAEVTAVMSQFRFASGAASSGELARFNDYVICQQAKVAVLRGRIRELKADCNQVRTVRDQLDAQDGMQRWASMWRLLGDKPQERSMELSLSLSSFYADDATMIYTIEHMLTLTTTALNDVSEALGPPGHAYVENVPTAATMLGIYAAAFKAPEEELHHLVDALHETRAALV